MHFFNLRRLISFNKTVLLIIILLLIIFSVFGSILYLSNTSNKTPIGSSNLKGYDFIKTRVLEISTVDNKTSQRAVDSLAILEDNTISNETRYKALADIGVYFSLLYSDTNDPKYKNIFTDLDRFAKDNFSKQYKKIDFSQICQDPSCANQKQPEEMLKIINDIKSSSDFSERKKDYMSKDLLNAGYINEKQIRFDAYFNYFDVIKRDKSTATSSANKAIYEEFKNFLQKTYPNEFLKYKL